MKIPTSALNGDVATIFKRRKSSVSGFINTPGKRAKRKGKKQWDIPIATFDQIKF